MSSSQSGLCASTLAFFKVTHGLALDIRGFVSRGSGLSGLMKSVTSSLDALCEQGDPREPRSRRCKYHVARGCLEKFLILARGHRRGSHH
jgi:hypothetical protein